MDFLDSRHLTNHDGFVQLFSEDDTYEYYVTSVPRGIIPPHEPAFYLEVKPGGAKKGGGRQHRVKVVWNQAARRYEADPARLEIAQNDYVTWHCERMAGSPPYAVRGKGRKGAFDSAALGPHAVFSHFFLQPGRYVYQVNGAGKFTVDVRDHRELAADAYAKRASTAPVVQIRKGRPDHDKLDVVAGQTVVWAVEHETNVVISSASTA